MRFHAIQNVETALRFLRYKEIKLVNIRGEDIVDGNPKLTLGLIWTIILHFQVGSAFVFIPRKRRETLVYHSNKNPAFQFVFFLLCCTLGWHSSQTPRPGRPRKWTASDTMSILAHQMDIQNNNFT